MNTILSQIVTILNNRRPPDVAENVGGALLGVANGIGGGSDLPDLLLRLAVTVRRVGGSHGAHLVVQGRQERLLCVLLRLAALLYMGGGTTGKALQALPSSRLHWAWRSHLQAPGVQMPACAARAAPLNAAVRRDYYADSHPRHSSSYMAAPLSARHIPIRSLRTAGHIAHLPKVCCLTSHC